VTPTAPAQKRNNRWIVPRTRADAVPTDVPDAEAINEYLALRDEYLALRDLKERDIVTDVVTVTVGSGGSATTIVDTVTKTLKSTATSKTVITSTITETDQVNAKTTITTTSTLTVTSTVVNTGVVETSTGPVSSGTNTGVPDNNTGHTTDSSGLSTGAKAGIGVGVGVGGLLVLGAALLLILRRRNRGPNPDHDDLVGASEVPIGGGGAGGGGRQPPMSAHTATAAAFLAPGRTPVKSPAPEGYRGTALGDGRTGFAKPEPYGSAYNTTPSPATTMANTVSPASFAAAPLVPGVHPEAAELGNDNVNATKWHDANASEIDGNAVLNHQSGPVYEMPTQTYH
jgi:hypothetical protein